MESKKFLEKKKKNRTVYLDHDRFSLDTKKKDEAYFHLSQGTWLN